MTRAMLAVAVALTLVHGIFRALGFAEHTSAIAGMPRSELSWILGPVYALSWMAFVTLAPILTLAAVMDLSWKSLRFLARNK